MSKDILPSAPRNAQNAAGGSDRWGERAGEPVKAAAKSVPAGDAVVFTEVARPATVPVTPTILEVVLRNGHVVRVPPGTDTDTLQRVLHALQATC